MARSRVTARWASRSRSPTGRHHSGGTCSRTTARTSAHLPSTTRRRSASVVRSQLARRSMTAMLPTSNHVLPSRTAYAPGRGRDLARQPHRPRPARAGRQRGRGLRRPPGGPVAAQPGVLVGQLPAAGPAAAPADIDAWMDRFAAVLPEAKHRAFARGRHRRELADLAGFAERGLSVEASTVMTATSVRPPDARTRKRPTGGCIGRRLGAVPAAADRVQRHRRGRVRAVRAAQGGHRARDHPRPATAAGSGRSSTAGWSRRWGCSTRAPDSPGSRPSRRTRSSAAAGSPGRWCTTPAGTASTSSGRLDAGDGRRPGVPRDPDLPVGRLRRHPDPAGRPSARQAEPPAAPDTHADQGTHPGLVCPLRHGERHSGLCTTGCVSGSEVAGEGPRQRRVLVVPEALDRAGSRRWRRARSPRAAPFPSPGPPAGSPARGRRPPGRAASGGRARGAGARTDEHPLHLDRVIAVPAQPGAADRGRADVGDQEGRPAAARTPPGRPVSRRDRRTAGRTPAAPRRPET